ncbi:MAG: endonuclease/exonuclease/phosphatase family protein [Chitinophagaceae bacterium]|nr:endonuclease/exonuclease/phosphatase family protein [Chitinophagaceae bacterium]
MRWIVYVFVAYLGLALPKQVFSQQIIVGTFNIRLDKDTDIGNLWVDRQPVIASMIRFHDFDILGTQEGMRHQLDELQASLPEYSWYGEDRGDFGGHSAIFFKKKKYKLLKGGDLWFSETPEKPSYDWDACSNRMLSWVKLEEISTGRVIFFFNTHLDSKGEIARQKSSKMALEWIKDIAGNDPVIFTGDFNSNMKSEPYLIIRRSGILEDSYFSANDPYQNNGSTNGFGKSIGRGIIDHIFISKHFKADRWGILTDTYRGKYPSDHFAVLAGLSLVP